MNTLKKSRLSTHALVALIFLSMGVLSFFFVPTHDDLISVNSFSFAESVEAALYYGNGRFLGNFFVKLCLNIDIVDALFRGVCMGGVIVLSAVLCDGYRKRSIALSAFLFLGMGLSVFKEVIVWGHGFYNYAPPVVLLLTVLLLLKRFYIDKVCTHKIALGVSLFLITFCQQLFTENCTTINLLVALAVFVWVCVSSDKPPKLIAGVCLAGSALGAAVMFVGPSLLGVADRLEEYRGFSLSILRNLYIIINNISAWWALWLILTVVLLHYIGSSQKKTDWIIKTVLVLFPVLSFVQGFHSIRILRVAVDAIFCIYLLCCVIVYIRSMKKVVPKLNLCVAAVSVLSVAQLLILNPIGARHLYITYTLAVLFVLCLYSVACENNSSRFLALSAKLIPIAGAVIYGAFLIIYVQLWSVHLARVEYAEAQLAQGKTEIEIIELPYEEFVCNGNESYVYKHRFNQGSIEEMSFTFISYSDYLEKSIAEQ